MLKVKNNFLSWIGHWFPTLRNSSLRSGLPSRQNTYTFSYNKNVVNMATLHVNMVNATCIIRHNFTPFLQPLEKVMFLFPFLIFHTLVQVWIFLKIISTFPIVRGKIEPIVLKIGLLLCWSIVWLKTCQKSFMFRTWKDSDLRYQVNRAKFSWSDGDRIIRIPLFTKE